MGFESGKTSKPERDNVIYLEQWLKEHGPREAPADHIDRYVAGRRENQALLEKVAKDFATLYPDVISRIKGGNMRSPEERPWLERDIRILCENADYLYRNADTSAADVYDRMTDLLALLAADRASAA